jgi:hypothetical protein
MSRFSHTPDLSRFSPKTKTYGGNRDIAVLEKHLGSEVDRDHRRYGRSVTMASFA